MVSYPAVSKTKNPGFGALVISLDFEIHWGVRDHHTAHGNYQKNLTAVHRVVPQILDLFEEFKIAATWATVGFLFANSRQELKTFSPTAQPTYKNTALNPYQEPVGETEKDDPLHFAPGLIRDIGKRPRQELATHTFSHYYCLEQGQDKPAFKADLASAAAIANKYGYPPRSIVFPRNQVNPNYIHLLKDADIVCYRGGQNSWMCKASATDKQKLVTRGARLLDHYLNLSGQNLIDWAKICDEDGLCNIAASRFLRPYSPQGKLFDPLRLKRIVNGIKAAATAKKIFHLWWHPHNFGAYPDENLAFLKKILGEFAHFKESYGMRSLTMAEIAQITTEKLSYPQTRRLAETHFIDTFTIN